MQIRFLPDEPLVDKDEDLLGFRDFISLLQDSIYNTQAPFVYGILGDWGTGKTSILTILQQRLEENLKTGREPFIPIWFNAWEYENQANIIYPLLHAIKKDYDIRFKALQETRGFGKKFLDVVATSTLMLADISLRVATKQLTGEAIELSNVAEQLEAVKKHPDEIARVLGRWADEVGELKHAFNELLNAYAEDLVNHPDYETTDKGKIRFVIFIDDLDRCLPETTIAILESIKNFLTVKRCIFVLGLNPKVVYQAIRIKYENLEIEGREYLEKILNYSFFVPEPESKELAKFAQTKLENLVSGANDRQRVFIEKFGDILQECQFSNPRKIKRILNRYLFFISRYDDNLDKYQVGNIIRLIILAEYFPSLFQLFLKNTSSVNSVIQQLSKVDSSEFSIFNFEQEFQVPIIHIHPQLVKMKGLFNLIEPQPGIGKEDLSKNIQAVFAITRLI